MLNVFLDTNVIIDFMAHRDEFLMMLQLLLA